MKTFLIPFTIFACLAACGSKSTTNDNIDTLTTLSDKLVSKRDTIIDFESSTIGQPALGFTGTSTGKEQTKQWKIVDDNSNKVIAQLAKNDGDYYNLLILEKLGYENFTMSVKVKSVSGNEDQGGGLVWRCLDHNNYYVARYNPLENNFRFYRVVNGSRKQLKSEAISIPSGEWFTMTIEMTGNKISCSLNGKIMIQTTDDTFSKAGRVGFWTKADAITYFDELSVKVD